MVFLKASVSCVLLACLAQQVCISNGGGVKGRREMIIDHLVARDGDSGGQVARHGDSGGQVARDGDSGRAGGRGRSTEPKGRFSAKNGMQCSWQSYKEFDLVRLQINCENSGDGVQAMKGCEYVGKPVRCPGYVSNPAGFWKQVARALKKAHDKLCEDTSTLVRAGMCKRAPKDAHFKFGPWVPRRVRPQTITASPRFVPTTSNATKRFTDSDEATAINGQACEERVDKQKLREEYCAGAWSSVCAFFFSMLDNEEC